MNEIVIIGGGLSGKLLAMNLLRRAPAGSVRIRMVDRRDGDALGPAYSNDSPLLLLNVRAETMGAFSADPEHFYRWARERDDRVDPKAFLPRRVFRAYVLSLLRDAVGARAGEIALEHVRGEATDVVPDGARTLVHVDGREPLAADAVVLALGNPPPCDPPVSDRSVLAGPRYVRDPWDERILDSLSPRDPVVFLGTGQTMVDLVLLLERRGHEGTMTAISRRGLLPMAHAAPEKYPSFFEELRASTRLARVLRTVREHVDRAARQGIDARAVVDSMRPHTPELWAGLPEAEKRRFLRHLARHWDRIRSRLPPESAATIERLRASGRLRIVTGRVRDVVDTGSALEVRTVPRGGGAPGAVTAALVANCIGPESDYGRVDHPLVKNLLRRGAIRPGPARLGIDVRPGGEVVGASGETSSTLFTLGSTRKGLLWETVAVPEIRGQAERLAGRLLDDGDEAAGA